MSEAAAKMMTAKKELSHLHNRVVPAEFREKVIDMLIAYNVPADNNVSSSPSDHQWVAGVLWTACILLTKFLCPLDEVLRLENGLAQANFVSFGPVPGGQVPVRDGYAPGTRRCATPRGVDSRRVFENRFTRSNVMAQRRGSGSPGSLP